MKFFLLLLTLTTSAFCVPPSPYNPLTYRLNTASTSLTASWPTTAQIGVTNAFAKVDIYNGTGSEIEVNCSENSTPSSSSDSMFVPASLSYSSPWLSLIPYPLAHKCWVRSVSGTISTGVIELITWGY